MFFIKNRKQQNVSVVVENEDGKNGLVFVMHGLGDSKESEHIVACSATFLHKDFTVVRFDTTNTFGESDGKFEDATLTNYYEDLEDIIEWASTQRFYKENFWLLGHSLGAISCALYAQKNNKKIRSLILIATPVNYKFSASTYSDEALHQWEQSGFFTEDRDGFLVTLKRNYMEDKKHYDLLKNPETFTMPVLMIASENDDVTPYEHQKILFETIQSEKKLAIIKNAPHTCRDQKDLNQIKIVLDEWIGLDALRSID